MLSHHGEYEWGSPKRPKTLEGLVLHALDDLDAKLSGAQEWMKRAEGTDGDWTGYWKALERYLYRPALSGEAFGEGLPLAEDFAPFEVLEAEEEFGARAEPRPPAESAAAPRQRARKPLPGQGDLGF
jgi:3'-5' exoribonuclease